MFYRHLLTSMGLTALLLTSTGCSQPSTTHSSSQSSSQEATSQADADEDYLTSLGLMKGHLIIAKELIDAGKPEQAEPHVGHPVEELYSDIEGELTERNVPDFKVTLNQFHDQVKTAPKSPKLKANYDSSLQAIDSAIAAVPESERQSPEFVLGVMNRLLNVANEEYEAAIANGKFVEVIEYQDSRGFVVYAEQMYQTIADSMSQKNPDTHQTITTTLTELKTAWPSAIPPNAPVMTPEQVAQLVTKIKESSQL